MLSMDRMACVQLTGPLYTPPKSEELQASWKISPAGHL